MVNDELPLLQKNDVADNSITYTQDARRALATKPTGVRGEGTTAADIEMVKKANISGIIFPWNPAYKVWWGVTALAAFFTVFFCPFQVAFEAEPGAFNDAAAVMEVILNVIFAIDIGVNFNLAFYKNELIVFERREIFYEYFSCMFWVDFVGVFPFESAALWIAGELGTSNSNALLFSLLRWLRFVRLHRMRKLSEILQYNARVSLLTFTLLRNFAVVVSVTHFEACTMYFIARLYNFGDGTWLGPLVQDMSGFQRYVTSLYWSIVTFCTVGYGDYSPVNSAEKLVGNIFMLLNIVVSAWLIGSITLLIVKGDEKTGEYRDHLETLHQYGEMHQFETPFLDTLKRQLRLEYNNREIADEQVLRNFPSAVRRKILRKLYLQHLAKTELLAGVRAQFVDAFLASCTVEIFSPGEVIVERGSILSDLFVLVGGIAEVTTPDFAVNFDQKGCHDTAEIQLRSRKLESGDVIGEIGFFTESPQVESVACLTVCKTLTIGQAAYRLLAQDHPGSVGKILQNLLAKVEQADSQISLPKQISILRAGSVFDIENGYGTMSSSDSDNLVEDFNLKQSSLTAVKDLVKMHMGKQLDDQTTRLLFAASRGDTATISLMCDQGFDPNNADYDSRTALMVASMKGNTDVVRLLLEYKADPNKTDMHGQTALLEAVKNGHEKTMDLLFKYKAELCMPESLAASVLCQAVYDGDILLLKRLLKAGINVNAADYDKRTAAHIAAAEGNVAAIKVLAENNADLTLEDRWKNTVQDEAKRSNARQLIAFLEGGT